MTLDLHVNVAVLLRSTETQEALREVFSDMNGTRVTVHVGGLEDVRPDIEAFANPDVLLLDINPRDEQEVIRLKEIMHSRFPGTPIVATAEQISLQGVRQLMQLGVVDFVPQPITRADLVGALEIAARRRTAPSEPEPDKGGRVFSFMKGGGGAGATTLAVQAACLLTRRAKAHDGKVCLMDLDVQFGTASLYLDLADRVGLADLIESPERIDAELLRSVMGRHECGLNLLAAPRDMMALEAVTPELIDGALKLARRAYEFVVLDLPSAWTPWSYKAIECSDLVFLVTQLSVPGVRQARRQIDTMMSNGLEHVPIKVVLNRFDRRASKSVNVKEAEKALGRPFDCLVINDYKSVSEAINQGVALEKIKKNSKVEASIARMVSDAVNVVTGDVEERAEPRLSFGFRR